MSHILSASAQKYLERFFVSHISLFPILHDIIQAGGRPFLVGGAVRDALLGLSVKDADIEVHHLTLEQLQHVLHQCGVVRLVGKQFGVLRIDYLDVDWSLPRTDSGGRKPRVEIDPFMGIVEASRRRDLTMNALSIDLTPLVDTGKFKRSAVQKLEITDPFGGLEDIKQKRIRVVDAEFFLQDPLRFYRVMQFAARFEMNPDEKLNALCASMSVETVSRERIWGEIKKMLLRSRQPSRGFRWIKHIGRLAELMPELGVLADVMQDSTHHPEGSVFEHTMQALDAAAVLEEYHDDREKVCLMWAVLCHDLGKATTGDAQYHFYGHDVAGVSRAVAFTKRFTDDKDLIAMTKKLVRYHLAPFSFIAQQSSLKAYKRLAQKLSPEVTIRQLALVVLCDARGRNGDGTNTPTAHIYPELEEFICKAQEAAIEHGPEEPVLRGRDLLDVMKPGVHMGELLRRAYELQIEEGITDKDVLKERVLGERDEI